MAKSTRHPPAKKRKTQGRQTTRRPTSSPRRQPSSRARPPWPLFAALAVAGLVLAIALRSGNGDGDQRSASGVTTNAARTGADFHSLAVDNSGRLFAGGHEAVSVSADGGRTWRSVASLDNADAMGWGFTADAVFVSGHPGLSRSDNGGKTFTRSNAGLPGTDLHAFGAGTAALYGAAAGAGVFASADGGQTWQVRSRDPAIALFGRIVVDPSNDEHVFASDARAGVLESTDGARTWRALGTDPSSWLSRGAGGVQTLIASGPNGTTRSTDGGTTWTAVTPPDGASIVEADPQQAGVLYAGIHDGDRVRVMVSRDDGRTWTRP